MTYRYGDSMVAVKVHSTYGSNKIEWFGNRIMWTIEGTLFADKCCGQRFYM